MNTGVSGAAALISSSVGSRRSANWNSDQPPTTRTHCGAGVRCGLLLQHPQGVGQRGHVLPAQLHVEVEAAADEVGVAVVEAGDDAPPAEVDHPGPGCRGAHHLVRLADGQHEAVADGERPCLAGGGSSVVIRPLTRTRSAAWVIV